MKIAFVHDYLKEVGGAEKVLMALKEMWPEAAVYTAYKFPKYWGQYKELLSEWDIRETWAKYLPLADRLLSYYTIPSPLFFSTLDLSGYDVVIVSQTGGYFPNGVKVGEKTKLITYCHTPPRFLYGYPTARNERYKWYLRPISEVVNHVLRMVDFKWAQRPDVYVANSKNIADRIWKFYRREAAIVYPPIEIQDSRSTSSRFASKIADSRKKDYYLIVSRIVGSKNIELAVEAANKYGFKLKVAGRPIGSSGKEIVKLIKGKTVEYLGEVSEEERRKLLAGAKGFLALESEADFGMTTVEPMVYGTSVIAFRAGGYLETVVEGKTGVFFDELTPESLWKAMQKFEKIKWSTDVLRKHAQKFSKERFKRQMLKLVEKYA